LAGLPKPALRSGRLGATPPLVGGEAEMEIEASRESGIGRGSNGASERTRPRFAVLAICVYLVAFVSGAIVMSFEMLGSRYLAPYFGAGIYTWASLISTVLAALCVGYFLGGALADRHPSPVALGATVAIGSVYLLLLPVFADGVLQFFVRQIDDIRLGSLTAALAIMFFPVTFLGMYSPFAIRLLLRSRHRSGVVSGTVYGVSTAGSILGTLGTTFVLIPLIGARAITSTLGICGILAGALLVANASPPSWRRARLGVLAVVLVSHAFFLPLSSARAEQPFNPGIRAAMLHRKDGLITHVETLYNDIFVSKAGSILKMAFQWKGWHFPESEINLADPDDLPMAYARAMTIAAVYPQNIKRVLMLGLGGGAIPTYLGRFLPDATIDTVELDPGVIDAAKEYFGIRETKKSHLIESDARVFLNRHSEPYDLILVDAFTGSYIPFHLMTKEFYRLVRDRLAPHGVAAFNILPGAKLFDSNVRTLKLAFDHIDLYHSGEEEVIVIGRLDSFTAAEMLQKAQVAQQRYRFRFDVSQLAAKRRIAIPKGLKGEVLTDDFAPADVFDAYGRRYWRKK
jgi:predicted membrane-bound spermidine synthase